jgi:hypothetical protein
MNMNVVKMIAGLAWAGAAISSAAPADALLITFQTGAYATCNPEWEYYNSWVECPLTPGEPEPFTGWYRQKIRFLTQGCNTGACSQDAFWVYTDFIYEDFGRKTTTLYRSCYGTDNAIYGLGTCGC